MFAYLVHPRAQTTSTAVMSDLSSGSGSPASGGVIMLTSTPLSSANWRYAGAMEYPATTGMVGSPVSFSRSRARSAARNTSWPVMQSDTSTARRIGCRVFRSRPLTTKSTNTNDCRSPSSNSPTSTPSSAISARRNLSMTRMRLSVSPKYSAARCRHRCSAAPSSSIVIHRSRRRIEGSLCSIRMPYPAASGVNHLHRLANILDGLLRDCPFPLCTRLQHVTHKVRMFLVP